MNKEERTVIIKLRVYKDRNPNQVYELEKEENLIIEGYDGTKIEKKINFLLEGKNHSFIMSFSPQKGLFGDKIYIGRISQGEFMPEQEPVEIETSSFRVEFKKNPWKTEGKILVGFIIISTIGLITAFFLTRRKKRI